MVFAWKNAHRFEASMWLASALVCEPLPRVSAKASTRASTAMKRATFLLEGSTCTWASDISVSPFSWDGLEPVGQPEEKNTDIALAGGLGVADAEGFLVFHSHSKLPREAHFRAGAQVQVSFDVRGDGVPDQRDTSRRGAIGHRARDDEPQLAEELEVLADG